MRYHEIMHTKQETEDQRLWRLAMIYGHEDDDELDEVKLDGARLKNEVERSKARRIDAETVAKLIGARDDATGNLDDVFPWPASGRKGGWTDEEKTAAWIRASLVAGKPLPPFRGQRPGKDSQ